MPNLKLEDFMRIFRENIFLLCWLLILTILSIYHVFSTNINVHVKVHAPEGIMVKENHEIKNTRS
jgi:hypothetical protein